MVKLGMVYCSFTNINGHQWTHMDTIRNEDGFQIGCVSNLSYTIIMVMSQIVLFLSCGWCGTLPVEKL